MAKQKKAEAAPPPAYEMPKVFLGDVVVWHIDRTGGPTAAAIVTGVANESVSLAILYPGYHNADPKEGVRHKDHPDQKAIDNSEVGCWDYTDRHRDVELSIETAFELASNPPPATLAE